MTELHYCDSWFAAKKFAQNIISEPQARLRHEKRASYTVLIGSPVTPSAFIEVLLDKEMIGVDFLDEHLRERLTYQFHEVKPGMLFLSMAVYREFAETSDNVVEGTSYHFKEDGRLTIIKETFSPHHLEESSSVFDPASNYEPVPSFGCYSSLISEER
ncbi:lytic transglycosylase [Stenotrophomonas maltophilia]|uniref:Lytic transglycosylase n=1 Tax=Stenotrophomonas maltophilia TaxID=40324 RepID=A0AAI9FTJ9_STEMA|nr:lytic transglycosylase [Stenotrophomonas maltophilia]UUS13061.1 hypothetical protein NMB32_12445 [Stenotrophomonas sp. CD2]AWT13968.1 lytic transglycosylase [Stenotrophomonas maltophilia]EKT4091347.1 hypothetical protein [Stenotrophomonas maltophilia]MBA0362855.1 lytic transglycosylase [Stenotrophomonas maltophilia]HEL4101611.1 hypothetical protein [Stenotrophomonas maltophilia]